MQLLSERIGRDDYAIDAQAVAEAMLVHLGGMREARSQVFVAPQLLERPVVVPEPDVSAFDDAA